MRSIIFFLFLICAGRVAADAGSASPSAQLEKALARVQQEQQSVYQQFQMVQELRRSELRSAYEPEVRSSTISSLQSQPTVNYDENVRLQREQQERIEQSTRNLNALYARYVELERERKALLNQIFDLARQPRDR